MSLNIFVISAISCFSVKNLNYILIRLEINAERLYNFHHTRCFRWSNPLSFPPMHSYPHCSIYNYWNIDNQIKKVFLLFELHSCFQSPWDIFSAGIWRPSMLSCKLELKFSLLSTFVCCSIALITLFVDLVAFSGSLCSVYFLQQFLTVFTWRAVGFFFK